MTLFVKRDQDPDDVCLTCGEEMVEVEAVNGGLTLVCIECGREEPFDDEPDTPTLDDAA